MKLFECRHCGQVLYFENVRCERCGHVLGFDPTSADLLTLRRRGDAWFPVDGAGRSYLFCGNAVHAACNWLVAVEAGGEGFCASCRLNHVIPDIGVAENADRWRRLEAAKRWLVYGLLRLGLAVPNKADQPQTGIAFDLLSDDGVTPHGEARVMTGHDNGLITINIAEADDAAREQMRRALDEPYRTPLGHFRHEIGHYYWDRLVRDGGRLDRFRAVFGDESGDYAGSLQRHYAGGPPPGWQQLYVSAYASAHPWEDFAETWAHYLHMVDTLETADAFGLRLRPKAGDDPSLALETGFDPYRQADFGGLIEAWLPLTLAANGLNRSMGLPDAYPFVLSPAALDKLRFVHDVIYAGGGDG